MTPAAFDHKTSGQSTPCPFCREEILLGAVKCKHCGSTIYLVDPGAGIQKQTPNDGAMWFALPSLLIGAFAAVAPLYLMFFEYVGIELSPYASLRLFCVALLGSVLGAITLRRFESRKLMAQFGIALSCVGMLASLMMTAS